MWFGGQRYFDPATQSWADTVYQDFANDIAVDGRGGLWVATGDGAIYIPYPITARPKGGSTTPRTTGLATTVSAALPSLPTVRLVRRRKRNRHPL